MLREAVSLAQVVLIDQGMRMVDYEEQETIIGGVTG